MAIVYKLVKFAVIAAINIGQAVRRDWSGSFGRWRRGEPLRQSRLEAIKLAARQADYAARKIVVREAYESDPVKLLDPAFKSEFENLGIYADVRAEVLARCGRKCMACGKNIWRVRALHIDHIKPRKHHPHLQYLERNLQVLCSRCNVHKSAYDGDDWKEVVVIRRKATRSKRAREVQKARNK